MPPTANSIRPGGRLPLISTCVFSLLTWGASAVHAEAIDVLYECTIIADQNDGLFGFRGLPPSLNASGQVAFVGEDENTLERGVYVGSGASNGQGGHQLWLAGLEDTGSGNPDADYHLINDFTPAINDGSVVLFRASMIDSEGPGPGVYKRTVDTPITAALEPVFQAPGFNGGFPEPSILWTLFEAHFNNAGTVLFRGGFAHSDGNEESGTYRILPPYTPGTESLIDEEIDGNPRISPTSDAWAAEGDAPNNMNGVYVDGVATYLVSSTDSSITEPDIAGGPVSPVVAYARFNPDASLSIMRNNTELANSDDDLVRTNFCCGTSTNADGQVAFRGSPEAEPIGPSYIYIVDDSLLRRVRCLNEDILFGGSLTSHVTSSSALNASGSVAFYAEREQDFVAIPYIVRADPVPEPGATTLAMVSLLTLIWVARRAAPGR